VPADAIRGDGQKIQTLSEDNDRLREELKTVRSQAEQERARERVRGWLALGLTGLLSFVLVATYAYLMILSLYFAEDLSTQEVTALIPMVGTTLLTPLVGCSSSLSRSCGYSGGYSAGGSGCSAGGSAGGSGCYSEGSGRHLMGLLRRLLESRLKADRR
jgi:uncharacterized membrane protein YgcG